MTDPSKSIRQGLIFENIVDTENIEWQTFVKLTEFYKIDLDKPYNDLSEDDKDIILHGSREPIAYEITSRGLNTFRQLLILKESPI